MRTKALAFARKASAADPSDDDARGLAEAARRALEALSGTD